MEQEKIINKTTQYSVNVANSKVESLRIKEDLKTVIRAYEGGNIGIAGRIGEGDDKALEKEAKEKLSQNIAYPCNLAENKKRSELTKKQIIPASEIVKTLSHLIERLSKTYPDFIFSNKINLNEWESVYENSKNTCYKYTGSTLSVMLVIKAKSSANIMDLFYGGLVDVFDEDKIVEEAGKLLNVYNNKLPLPEEDLPVIIGEDVLSYAVSHMGAERYVSGTSLLSGKLGEKVFDEKVNIYTNRAPDNKFCIEFFDAEGTVCENDKFYFVKDGVFCGIITNKRSAEKFSLPLSGGAYAEYDEVPNATARGTTVGHTANKLSDIVKGKAIYISYTSGGDMTPDGTLGIPVQLAYLYEDGKLLGALPEFSLSASIFDLLGKDFVGAAKSDVFEYAGDNVIVGKFKINK